MLGLVPSSEKTKAVKYLIDHIPDKTLSEIAKLIRENGKDWGVDHHHGFGTGVRNLLREGGFEWGPDDLDNLWVRLVGRAVRKNFDKPPNSEISHVTAIRRHVKRQGVAVQIATFLIFRKFNEGKTFFIFIYLTKCLLSY